MRIFWFWVRCFLKLLFFRHTNGLSGAKAGDRFGNRYYYKWWKKACNNLGVEGVDLYGGTKHSTATALSEYFSPEEIRKSGTMHTTNKAFERYFQVKPDKSKKLYSIARIGGDKKQKKYGDS